MKRQCVHFQRLHIFSSQTSKLIGKYSKNCNCFHWWPSHWVQTRPARMTLESLLQSSLWITGVKKKKSPLVPDIYPLPFMSCILALVGCTQSNEGSPSGMWVHLQAWDCLCMISRQYVATSAKIISFETNCCKLQNPGPIIHLVQTWILRVPGSPSTDSSVEVHEERRALQIFRTQLRMSLGSRTFLSALISPSWSLCPSVPYTLGLCGSYPHSVLFISFPKVCIRSPSVSKHLLGAHQAPCPSPGKLLYQEQSQGPTPWCIHTRRHQK